MNSTLNSSDLPVLPADKRTWTIALAGNPNAGKTSLFNRLTGLRAQTANFPGTTVEHRRARISLGGQPVTLIDLPGMYTLDAVTLDEHVAVDTLLGKREKVAQPDAVLVVLDSTNLERNLLLTSQILHLQMPTLVALNMIDTANHHGLQFDLEELSQRLGCPVIPVSARTGQGFQELNVALEHLVSDKNLPTVHPSLEKCTSCSGCQYSARHDWAGTVCAATASGDTAAQNGDHAAHFPGDFLDGSVPHGHDRWLVWFSKLDGRPVASRR